MSVMERKVPHIILFLCLVFFVQEVAACDSPATARHQTPASFYNKDAYGRLGVKDGQYLRILDEYRCYDLTSLDRQPLLSIYFNNASDDDNNEPTYVGAVIIRVFRSGEYQEGPFSAYLYRNTTRIARNTSKWAHGNAELGTKVKPPDLKILGDELDSEDAIRGKDFTQLDSLLRLGQPETEARLQDWHSLVVGPQEDGYVVYRNTLKSDTRWALDSKLKNATGSYLIARNYLIKYQTSNNPQPEVYFQTGAAAADCVYIKLIAPGDGVSNFAIAGSGRFISLKMKRDAKCVTPD